MQEVSISLVRKCRRQSSEAYSACHFSKKALWALQDNILSLDKDSDVIKDVVRVFLHNSWSGLVPCTPKSTSPGMWHGAGRCCYVHIV